MANDDQLKHELAIKELGVRLSLKEFCASRIKMNVSDEREQKKQRLISELIEGKKDKSKTKKAESKRPEPTKVPTRNMLMGWLHNGVRVGLDKGGGTREMRAPVKYNYMELLEVGKNWFFPDGKSLFGNIEDMKLGIVDFKRQPLTETIEDLTFTLGDYCDKNGFKSRVRFYFSSEKKEQTSLSFSSDDDDLPSPWPRPPADESATTSDLIGNTQERLELREEQDKAYLDSLTVDSRKVVERRQALEEEVKNVTRQENLRSERAQRVQAEPKIEDDHVIVLVRHLSLGSVSRMFLKNSTMNQVYDWVGSLSLLPEHFRLVYPLSGEVVLPERPVTEAANCVLCMNESEEPLSLVHDDPEISAIGFSGDSVPSIDTVPEFLPEQFMEGDENETVRNNLRLRYVFYV